MFPVKLVLQFGSSSVDQISETFIFSHVLSDKRMLSLSDQQPKFISDPGFVICVPKGKNELVNMCPTKKERCYKNMRPWPRTTGENPTATNHMNLELGPGEIFRLGHCCVQGYGFAGRVETVQGSAILRVQSYGQKKQC